MNLKKRSLSILCISLFMVIICSSVLNMLDLKAMLEIQEQNMIDLANEVSRLEQTGQILYPTCDVEIIHRRDGIMLGYWRHAGSLSDVGRDFIEGKLYDNSFANTTKYAEYIAVSGTAESFADAWRTLPEEITDSGLARAQGAYVSTGVGACNVSYTFNVSGTKTVNDYGLLWDSGTTKSLVWYDSSTDKNVENGDTLKVTFQLTDNDS